MVDLHAADPKANRRGLIQNDPLKVDLEVDLKVDQKVGQKVDLIMTHEESILITEGGHTCILKEAEHVLSVKNLSIEDQDDEINFIISLLCSALRGCFSTAL